MNTLTQIGLSSLAGLAITAGIGAATNTVSSTPARRVADSQRSPVRATLDRERLIRCIEAQESGGREQVIGDRGRSWGLFQMGRARYSEGGGRNYGKAGRTEQTRVMRVLLSRYLRDCKGTVEQQIVHASRSHNGFGKASIRYAADILRRYKGIKP